MRPPRETGDTTGSGKPKLPLTWFDGWLADRFHLIDVLAVMDLPQSVYEYWWDWYQAHGGADGGPAFRVTPPPGSAAPPAAFHDPFAIYDVARPEDLQEALAGFGAG